MNKILTLICIISVFACDTSPQKVSFDIVIDGMSCSRSCSPYIEKKLKKMEGVFEASVSFEKKLAEITIDANEISIAEVVNEIETIADRQYKVEAVKESEMEKKKEILVPIEKPSLDFDIINPDVSHSTGFQLPNLFSLLNSLIH